MTELEVQCILSSRRQELGGGGWFAESTYKSFSISIDDIKKHKVYHATCPSCGCALQLNIFPGLPFHKVIAMLLKSHQIKDRTMSFFVFSSALFAMLLVILPGFRERFMLWWGGFLATIIIAAYALAAIFSWIGFLMELFGTMRMRCFIKESYNRQSLKVHGHGVSYKGRDIKVYDFEEVRQREPYYK